jgi:hypothetical protein
MYYGYNKSMKFENTPQEPQINDFMREKAAYMAKWQAEGNVDSEFDIVSSIEQQVLNGAMTPQEGILRLRGIDGGRIER